MNHNKTTRGNPPSVQAIALTQGHLDIAKRCGLSYGDAASAAEDLRGCPPGLFSSRQPSGYHRALSGVRVLM